MLYQSRSNTEIEHFLFPLHTSSRVFASSLLASPRQRNTVCLTYKVSICHNWITHIGLYNISTIGVTGIMDTSITRRMLLLNGCKTIAGASLLSSVLAACGGGSSGEGAT